MDFRLEQRIGAPLPHVEAAQTDPAFIAELASLPKIGNAELLGQHREGDVVEQEVRYVFTGELSSAVRAVVDPKKITWILESRFDGAAHHSHWRILPDHYPDRLSASGTTRLLADGDAVTRRVTQGVVKVHMALVGGRVERAIVTGLKEHAEAEAAAMERYLTRSDG
ncbi:MAG: DUF2505 family protein [Actinobacteria bacterium]|nr:DUF2505 family protein [Actinomycetota bacterium]